MVTLMVMMLMRMRMLAFSVMRRRLLEWLALCHSWQKGGVVLGIVLGIRVVIYLGGELVLEIFVRGSVYFFLRDVVRTFCIFFLSLSFRYMVFVHRSGDHLVIANLVFILYIYISIFDEVVITFFHLSLHVLFLFSFYAHASYLLYAIFYFCFTLRCRDEYCLKCFRNIGCQSLLCHELCSCKVFQEFMLG